MNRKLIAVDCGKAETKVYGYDMRTGQIRNEVIRSRAEHADDLVKLSLREGSHIVTFAKPDKDMEGEWTIGALGGQTSYSNSKMDHIHKIMTLLAIALVTDNGDSVSVSIGCPMSVFSNDIEKKQYADYILPNGRVDLVVDGQEHYFYIEKDRCMVFPESFGALFLFEDKFEGKAGVIDIGGLNVNASFFLDKTLDPYNSKTEKLGYYALISLLRNRLNAYCDASFDDNMVEHFLKQGYVDKMKETAKIIEEVMEQHVARIERVLKDWDRASTTLIFIGGTSKLLQKQIMNQFGKTAVIPEDANLINSRGFLRAMIIGNGYKSPI